MDAVLFKLTFVVNCVVAVAGKAVQLPDQDRIENLFGTVLDHPLELRTVIGLGRVSPVDVSAHDCDAVALGVVFAVPLWPQFQKLKSRRTDRSYLLVSAFPKPCFLIGCTA